MEGVDLFNLVGANASKSVPKKYRTHFTKLSANAELAEGDIKTIHFYFTFKRNHTVLSTRQA